MKMNRWMIGITLLLTAVLLFAMVGCGEDAKKVACPECGAENDASVKFCGECGSSINLSTPNESNTNTPANTSKTESTTAAPDPAETAWLLIKEPDPSNSYYYHKYSYDYDGNLVADQMLRINDDYLAKVRKYTYTYDATGRLIKTVEALDQKNMTNDTGDYTYVTEYKYDTGGNLIEEVRIENKSKEVVSYKLYDQGRLKYSFCYMTPSLNSSIRGYYLEEYKYHSDELLYIYRYLKVLVGDKVTDTKLLMETDWGDKQLVMEEQTFDFNGCMIKRVVAGIGNTLDNGSFVPTGKTNTATYRYETDRYGNTQKIIWNWQDDTSPRTLEGYDYMSLAEYREKGLYGAPDVDGTRCSECKEAGHEKCLGHDCAECGGDGAITCSGCRGTGKKAYSHLPDNACPVCLGLKTQECPPCDGTGKMFYD